MQYMYDEKPWLPKAYNNSDDLSGVIFPAEAELQGRFTIAHDYWRTYCQMRSADARTKIYYRETLKPALNHFFEEAGNVKSRHMNRKLPWNSVSRLAVVVDRSPATVVWFGAIIYTVCRFLAEFWGSPSCGLPNPISALGGAILNFLGRIAMFTASWLNRKQLIKGEKSGIWFTGVFSIGGLSSACGTLMTSWGEVYLAKLDTKQDFCYKNADIGGVDNFKKFWAMAGPGITGMILAILAAIGFGLDRRECLGPHGILNFLRHPKDYPSLTMKERKILVDTLLYPPQYQLPEEVVDRAWWHSK